MTKALSYQELNEIESHFICAQEERLKVQEIERDIAEESSYTLDPTGVHSTKVSDVTADRAQRIERETRVLRAWGDVVKETFEHFRCDALMLNLLSLLYVEKVGADKIMDELYIGKTTLYEYRKEILRYAALKAVAKGIFIVG